VSYTPAMFAGRTRWTRSGDRPVIHLILPKWGGWGLNKTYFHRLAPMSLLVLAALAEREGWQPRIIDEDYETIPSDKPDLAAITVWTGTAPRSYQIADAYRARGVPVVLGGVHASMLPGEAGRHADAVVGGEAELVLGQVLDDALKGQLKPYYHGPWPSMEQVPMVDEMQSSYQNIPFGRYRPSHSMQTTRGCRFNCEYCSVIRINGRGSRHADVSRVIEDIRIRSKMKPAMPGPTFVFFVDDDFGSDLDYVGELCEAILSSGLDVFWVTQANIGFFRNRKLVELAARAGCRSIFSGLESVSRSSLIEANKKNRPSEYKELIECAHVNGIAVEGTFIFGFDQDGPECFDETVEVLDDINIDLANFFALTPLPGTNTFARYYEEGRIDDFDWGHYDSYTPVFTPARMSKAELQEGIYRTFRKFYSRPLVKRRLRSELFRREIQISATYWTINRTYQKMYYRPPTRESRAQPPFTPDPADLEALLRTSRAEAQDAISVAAEAMRTGGGTTDSDAVDSQAVPIGTPRRRVTVS